jgi:hypothetical protein
MAATASLFASLVDDVLIPLFGGNRNDKKTDSNLKSAPFVLFSKPAITCALGSPLGYMALKYIPFPLGNDYIINLPSGELTLSFYAH